MTVAPALALAVTAAIVLLLVTSRAAAWVGLDAVFVFLEGVLRIPAALLLLALVVSAVYILAPTGV